MRLLLQQHQQTNTIPKADVGGKALPALQAELEFRCRSVWPSLLPHLSSSAHQSPWSPLPEHTRVLAFVLFSQDAAPTTPFRLLPPPFPRCWSSPQPNPVTTQPVSYPAYTFSRPPVSHSSAPGMTLLIACSHAKYPSHDGNIPFLKSQNSARPIHCCLLRWEHIIKAR